MEFEILKFLLIENCHIRELNFSYSSVEVQVVLIFYKVQIFLIFTPQIFLKYDLVCPFKKFDPFVIIEGDVPDPVGVEAGEAVSGRTDGHVGELQVRDGEGLDSGGDWAGCPGGEGLGDHVTGPREANEDDKDPQESGNTLVGGDVDKTVDGGGLQELLDAGLHPEGLELTVLSNVSMIIPCEAQLGWDSLSIGSINSSTNCSSVSKRRQCQIVKQEYFSISYFTPLN